MDQTDSMKQKKSNSIDQIRISGNIPNMVSSLNNSRFSYNEMPIEMYLYLHQLHAIIHNSYTNDFGFFLFLSHNDNGILYKRFYDDHS